MWPGVQPDLPQAGVLGGDSLATIHDLKGDELLKLLKTLALHADRKLARLRWRGVQGGSAAPGHPGRGHRHGRHYGGH